MIDITSSGTVTTIMLDRQEVSNAFNAAMIDRLIQAFESLHQNTDTHIVILKGRGKNFCSGGDLQWMQQMVNYSHEENVQDANRLAHMIHLLDTLPQTTIAIAQGATMGGGLGLLACSDIVIATQDALFCFSEVKIGLIPAVISPFVIAKIGMSQMRKLFLTAERFTSSTAQRIGLVHDIVDSDAIDTTLQHYITLLQQNSPHAMRSIKYMTHNQFSSINTKLLQQVADQIAAIRISPQGQEGLKSFLEKRKPHWNS